VDGVKDTIKSQKAEWFAPDGTEISFPQIEIRMKK